MGRNLTRADFVHSITQLGRQPYFMVISEIGINVIIGYTTGVFDMFHVGHLNILKKAKEHCDYLIVGVSTDELVIQYKGKTPIISQTDRAEIISSICYVDKVVYQKNRDKMAAYDKLKFDVMFVGDDWKNDALFREVEKKLRSFGSRVQYFPYTKHVSSTMLKEALHAVELTAEGL